MQEISEGELQRMIHEILVEINRPFYMLRALEDFSEKLKANGYKIVKDDGL